MEARSGSRVVRMSVCGANLRRRKGSGVEVCLNTLVSLWSLTGAFCRQTLPLYRQGTKL
jgi:hypothetical protein